VLASSLTLALPAEDAVDQLQLPDEDASPEDIAANPVGQKIKETIESGVRQQDGYESAVVTITKLLAGSLVVDFNVEVPMSAVSEPQDVDDEPQDGATDEATDPFAALIEGVADAFADVELPTTEGEPLTIAADAVVVETFKSYVYQYTPGCAPVADCSNACGYEGYGQADIYRCLEDGIEVDSSLCVDAGFSEPAASESICCPPADEATCQTFVAVPDIPEEEPEAEPEIVPESGGGSGAAIAVAVVAVLVVLVVIYWVCRQREDKKQEEHAKAQAEHEAEMSKVMEAQKQQEKRKAELQRRLEEVQRLQNEQLTG